MATQNRKNQRPIDPQRSESLLERSALEVPSREVSLSALDGVPRLESAQPTFQRMATDGGGLVTSIHFATQLPTTQFRHLRYEDDAMVLDVAYLSNPFVDEHRPAVVASRGRPDTGGRLHAGNVSRNNEGPIHSSGAFPASDEVTLTTMVEPAQILGALSTALPATAKKVINDVSPQLMPYAVTQQPERMMPAARPELQSTSEPIDKSVHFASMLDLLARSTRSQQFTPALEKSASDRRETAVSRLRSEHFQAVVVSPDGVGSPLPVEKEGQTRSKGTGSSFHLLAGGNTGSDVSEVQQRENEKSLIDAIRDGYDRYRDLQQQFPDSRSPASDPDRNSNIRHQTWNWETADDLSKTGVDPYLAATSLFAWGLMIETGTFAARGAQSLYEAAKSFMTGVPGNYESLAELYAAGIKDIQANAAALSAFLEGKPLALGVDAQCGRMDGLSCGLISGRAEPQYSLGIEGLGTSTSPDSKYGLGVDYTSVFSGDVAEGENADVEGGTEGVSTQPEMDSGDESGQQGGSTSGEGGGWEHGHGGGLSEGGQSGGNQSGGDQSSGGSCNTGNEPGSPGGQCTPGGSSGGASGGGEGETGGGEGGGEGGGSEGGGGCFLTSACLVTLKSRDAEQKLNSLRAFRDGYIRSTPGGADLIADYYCLAPRLVELIDTRPDRRAIYQSIYHDLVVPTLDRIEAGQYQTAVEAYRQFVLDLCCSFRVFLRCDEH